MKSVVLCCIFSIFLVEFVYSKVTLSAVKQDSTQIVTFLASKSFELQCNATSDDKNEKLEVDWKYQATPIDEVVSLKDRFKTSSKGTVHTLEIKDAKESDIGNYTCENDNAEKDVEFAVIMKPSVKVPANLNTVEFETLRIHCTVYGKPHSEISWYYSNDTNNFTDIHELDDRISLEKDEEKGVEDAVLVLKDVQLSDRGEYTCLGQPPYGHKTVNSTCMVRVKDKYAAVWPFLGICAEVFVLCAIILIYEKKRNKTELDESDTDQSPDQKNTPDHNKDSNLRHRQ